MNYLKRPIQAVLGNFGLEVRRKQVREQTKLETLLAQYRVDMVFDVGANIGQYGPWFRWIGFDKAIVSFEPISHLFQQLSQNAKSDPKWLVEQVALGEKEGSCVINVSGGHGGASSLLTMTEHVVKNAPDQAVIRQEEIRVTTVEKMMEKYYPEGDRLFLKIDAQGYERNVIEGIGSELYRVIGLKVEMSLVENYCGELLMVDMLSRLNNMGFHLVEFENGWSNEKTGEMYQVDGVFFRTDRPTGISAGENEKADALTPGRR
ncbi:MAG: FkbM family methyltransferase [Nitrospira sp.]|nr:FkbM family methyltransferase [Nitrospira sp.]